MIATVRGLAVLAGIAAVLAVLVVVCAPAERTVVDRALVPGFEAADVTELAVTRAPEPPVTLVLGPRGWIWKEPKGDAEPAAIDAMFSALRAGTWHRRGERSAAGPLRGELRVTSKSGPALQLGVGQDLAGTGQTWIVAADRALLVDTWVARALVPEAAALRLRHPAAGAAAARAFSATGFVLDGTQRRTPSELWVDPALRDALVEALVELQIVALPPAGPRPGLDGPMRQVAFDGAAAGDVVRWGACAGTRILLAASTGDGCVESASWLRVETALNALLAPPETIADRRLLPIAPVRLESAGVIVDLRSPPRVGSEDADPTKIAELVAALTTQAEITKRPEGLPLRTIVARDARDSEVRLEVFADVIARAGEPFALRPTPDAWAVITRPLTAVRDPVLWSEDATTIASITIAGVTYKRGVVIGEWLRHPSGNVDVALVDALASSLATVRAPVNPVRESPPTPLRMQVTFRPPAGAPRTHELALGAPGHGGCPARIDGASVIADLALCTAAHALVAAR